MPIYGHTRTAPAPVWKDGRWFSSQAAADAGPKPSPRRARQALRLRRLTLDKTVDVQQAVDFLKRRP